MNLLKGIQTKLLLLVIIMTTLLIGITTVTSIIEFKKFVEESVNKEMNTVQRDLKNEIEMLRSLTLEQTKAISYMEIMRNAVKKRDREAIFKIFDDYKSSKKCEFFTIIDPDGKVLVRTANRTKFGDVLGKSESVKIALEEKIAGVYFESTKTIPLSIRGTAPIFDGDGTFLGVISSGFRLDTEEWVTQIKQTLGAESATIIGEKWQITTMIQPDDKTENETNDATKKEEKEINIKNSTKSEDQYKEIIETLFTNKKEYIGESVVLGQKMKVCYLPVLTNSKNVLGSIMVGLPLKAYEDTIKRNLVNTLIIVVVGLAIFILSLVILLRRIVGPIRRMTIAANELAGGGLDIDLEVNTGDELEVLSNSFKEVALSLKEKTEVALNISKGDLRVWVPLKSENDTLGKALIEMRYGFYDSIKDLKALASAVANEGDNLTMTNGRLVANINESASQLQDVASSIDQLNTQTKENAGNAREAESLAVKAHSDTTEGQQRMNRMVDSMNAITKSSEEIKKIIRVIDDIAFQTNLLALNAAVEAARAGQHGKGFAVVAEEVRSLAARSAKAAKETAGLIEESIHQVELGSHVANETSESLNSIATQVARVNEIIAKISHETEAQTESLNAVNTSVSRLSNTANENKVTVMESADAVTTVSNTAQQLDGITNHFQVNEGGKVAKPEGKNIGYIPPSKS
ncbi:MAG: methyl-accepting chemotaxis protein [Planctomycetaceae bacterium]|jgi:methyl-accepting chemotaxis protein|nr:methyl-accepting chemotaxis protein [Planctomycetaceae bacterium]